MNPGPHRRRRLMTVLAVVAGYLSYVQPAQAGRPLETEDPGTTEHRSFEVELGGKATHAVSDWGGADLGLNLAYGLFETVEVAASVGGTALDQEGWKPDVLALALFAKWRLFGEEGTSPALALFVSGGLPTHAPHLWLHGRGYGLAGGAAFSMPLPLDLLARVAALYQVQFDEMDLAVGSMALEWQATGSLALVCEAVAELAPSSAGESWAVRGLLGAAVAVHSAVSLDVGIGVEGDEDIQGVAGVVGVTLGF